jgi:lysine 6-dehydrogenase
MGRRFLLLGAGSMGRAIAFDLVRSRGKDCLRVLDSNRAAVRSITDWLDVDAYDFDVNSEKTLKQHTEDTDAVIVALPYRFNLELTKASIDAGCHFCDLGGNDSIVSAQLALDGKARENDVLCLPDCGLAPGMANVLAAHLITKFDKVNSLTIRVGGLPQHPRPPLNYQLFFSIEGLINEYVETCKVLRSGKVGYVEPMTNLETLEFQEVGELEAFNTSGGAARLPELYEGKIDKLDYKTIRYPGHCDIMKAILDLGLASDDEAAPGLTRRQLLERVLTAVLSGDDDDVVLVRVTAEGKAKGERKALALEVVDRYDAVSGLTAMMRTTAFPTSIIIQMAVDGLIPDRGVRTPEMCVPGKAFIEELAKREIRVVESAGSL